MGSCPAPTSPRSCATPARPSCTWTRPAAPPASATSWTWCSGSTGNTWRRAPARTTWRVASLPTSSPSVCKAPCPRRWTSAGRPRRPGGSTAWPTTWLAGGGIRGGRVIGATDEFGSRAVQDRVHVTDLHATVLKLLGLDHRQLTFLFEGRQQRLTDVGGDHEFANRLLQ